jgi:hypothetical protein
MQLLSFIRSLFGFPIRRSPQQFLPGNTVCAATVGAMSIVMAQILLGNRIQSCVHSLITQRKRFVAMIATDLHFKNSY